MDGDADAGELTSGTQQTILSVIRRAKGLESPPNTFKTGSTGESSPSKAGRPMSYRKQETRPKCKKADQPQKETGPPSAFATQHPEEVIESSFR